MIQQVDIDGERIIPLARGVALVASKSQPGWWHIVKRGWCDCPGFAARGRCRHVRIVAESVGAQQNQAPSIDNHAGEYEWSIEWRERNQARWKESANQGQPVTEDTVATLRRHYYIPDRSDRRRYFTTAPDNEIIDIGWDEGLLRDGRAFVVELLCYQQVTLLTIFWSAIGQEDATSEELGQTLVNEGILRFAPTAPAVAVRRFVDPSGHPMWAVNVVVADEHATYVVDALRVKTYR